MKIAIQGHSTRGKEVIQILKSLGGKNRNDLTGRRFSQYYFINCNGDIDLNLKINLLNYKLYTLEEFEKEFPFKIGDKVTTTGTNHPKIITGITDTQWGLRYVISEIKFPDSKEMPHISQISLYKEMKEERNITLTLDKAKEWYNKGGELREVALQAYSEKELTRVELPKTWEEFCTNYPVKNGECYISSCCDIAMISECIEGRDIKMDRNVCSSQKSAEAHLAMIQLEQLRDCWRNGWVPSKGDSGFGIQLDFYEGFRIVRLYSFSAFLSFPTEEIAKEFLECFRDLIEKAGDLI